VNTSLLLVEDPVVMDIQVVVVLVVSILVLHQLVVV
jgi:hypothetical protein